MVRRTGKAANPRQSRPPQPAAPAAMALGESLDLNAATGLREALLALRGADLTVDASDVQYLGTPCAQVLAAAVNTWKADGGTLTITSASEPFRLGAQLLGLTALLNPDRIRA